MRTFLNALLGGGLLMLGQLAFVSAAAASCEGIQNAFAYNDCLAKEGPQKRGRAPTAGRGVDPESTVSARGRRGRVRAAYSGGGNGVVISRRAGNRVSAAIDPWGTVRASDRTMRAKGRGKRRR